MTPRFVVQQKLTAFVNRYEIYTAAGDGERGELVAFAQQRRLALKEKIDFYRDESKAQLLFSMRAEKVVDVHGRYFIEDPQGRLIGMLRKEFMASLLKSTWHLLDPNDKTLLIATESNPVLAAFRRFGGFIPVVGDVVDLICALLRYHFVIRTKQGEEVGQYVKTTLIRDHYRLDTTDTAYQQVDWRVYAAFAVALDALQSR